jgi:hypothetical protein
MLAVDGESRLLLEDGPDRRLPAGSTTLVPFAAGPMRIETDGSVLVARPPAAQ